MTQARAMVDSQSNFSRDLEMLALSTRLLKLRINFFFCVFIGSKGILLLLSFFLKDIIVYWPMSLLFGICIPHCPMGKIWQDIANIFYRYIVLSISRISFIFRDCLWIGSKIIGVQCYFPVGSFFVVNGEILCLNILLIKLFCGDFSHSDACDWAVESQMYWSI